MALSTKERNKLPDEDFALPEQRKYPIHDEHHAELATSPRFLNRASPEEQKRIKETVGRRYPNLGGETGPKKKTQPSHLAGHKPPNTDTA